MPRIEVSIDIAAAPADVFRFCHDVTRRAEWDERVVHAELISSTPIRQGTLLRIDAGHRGRFAFTWDAEYVEFQFPSNSMVRVIDAAPSSPFRAGSERWQFSSLGPPGSVGTRFTVIWDYQLRTLLDRIADALTRRASTRHAIQRSLANLKAILERR